MSRPTLMSVSTELVKDVLVREILSRAQGHAESGPPPGMRDALSSELSLLGYFARLAETELFERGRGATPGVAERLEALGAGEDWLAAASKLSRELAAAEPSGRPDPGDDSVASWRVPGPGGHVRHYVATLAAGRGNANPDPGQSKRAFMYGFFLRCCEESLKIA